MPSGGTIRSDIRCLLLLVVQTMTIMRTAIQANVLGEFYMKNALFLRRVILRFTERTSGLTRVREERKELSFWLVFSM